MTSTAVEQGTLCDRVREILPEIAGRARETEMLRRLPDENLALLKEIGFIRALVPAMYGGDEIMPDDWLQAIRLLSSACVSTGWAGGVLSSHAHGLIWFDQRCQEEVWSTGADTVFCTGSHYKADVKRVDGGYRITAHNRFASGCDHSSWAMLGYPVPNEAGEIEFTFFMVPRSDWTIDDTWYSAGLRGSGSKDIIVEDAFVPEHRKWGPAFDMPQLSPDLHSNGLYRLPFLTMFPAIFAPIALGGAEGAYNAYQESLKNRIRLHTGTRAVESPLAHARLAEAWLELRSAGAILDQHYELITHHARHDIPVSDEQVMKWRVEDSYVGKIARRVVERIMEGAGGSAHYDSNPLQRYWRDVHTATGHVWHDVDSSFQVLGRLLLDLPPDPHLM